MKSVFLFRGQHVLITGAARGIGLEIARHFAREGAALSLLDNQAPLLSLAMEELRPYQVPVYPYHGDVTDRNRVQDIVLEAEKQQPIDILINNAGIATETPFLDITEEEWKKIMDVNLNGMFHVSQLVSRRMVKRKKGIIIHMASKNGLDGEFGYAHYNASKGGIIMLTKTMALELAHLGIRVNAVCPGYIQTPMSAEIDSPEFTKAFAERYIPLNRPGLPEEIAPLFLFLAGPGSTFITGQVFIADGGQLAGQKPGAELLNKIKI